MNLYDAIYQGIQTTHFLAEELPWELVSDILNYANNLEGLIPDAQVEFKLINNTILDEKFHGLFSLYAPYYLLIAAKESTDYLLNVGYLMQQMRLYLNTKWLGTSYVYVRAPKHFITSSMKYPYIMTIAFGKPDTAVYQKTNTDIKRLPEDATVVYKEKVSLPVRKVVNAALMAPSIMKTQPWRLVAYQNRIHIFTKKNILLNSILNKNKQIDMGMLLANLYIAADEQWLEVSMKFSELIQGQKRKSTDYLTTVMITQNMLN